MNARWTALSASLALVLCSSTAPVGAQSPKAISDARNAVHTVDRWLVTRYRSLQLLPDSVRVSGSPDAELIWPRVETAVDGSLRDTLFAVQFGARGSAPALRAGARVRLTAPSGTITAMTADVVARRPFRAPRLPGADTATVNGWRYGWAYLAIVRRGTAATASVYRGWLLYDVSDTTRRR